jgi:hypothetical protein
MVQLLGIVMRSYRSWLTSPWMHTCSCEPSTDIYGMWNFACQIDYK